ncbi:DNA-binding transcriptional regulator Cro [Vreelandella titanicae]|uniref:Cro/CI family transcriptional regulator n=1 Tax=Vreelandella titanicae TaxID=664683 RepID=UPI000885659B|nr:Cro/CI family transcriptional regulator [Halomonas titanicae]SDI28514.1 DNA-binding transcriptional regulator Cro [Halomonas titanicae]
MKTIDAIKHFGGKKIDLAKALGLSPSAITQWGDDVPLLRQYQLERITKGALKAEPIAA